MAPKHFDKIVCVQSRNDLTGSPKVLGQCIRYFIHNGYSVDLHCSNMEAKGFLKGIRKANYFPFHYHMHRNKLKRAFNFFAAHILLGIKMWRYRNQNVVFYINTLLPFGAALMGWLMGKPVIYHVHEAQLAPLFRNFLMTIARISADQVIYVSKYLQSQHPIIGVPGRVIYNGLPQEFIFDAMKNTYYPNKPGRFNVLMLASLIASKGLHQMVALAKALPQAHFQLIISESMPKINAFFEGEALPDNLTLFPAQEDVMPFYANASLVINLSDTKKYIESFGLTLIEAMAHGIPVIAPPVGGPAELVEDGVNGYKIDSANLDAVVRQVKLLIERPMLCMELSAEALQSARKFDPIHMESKILQALTPVEGPVQSTFAIPAGADAQK